MIRDAMATISLHKDHDLNSVHAPRHRRHLHSYDPASPASSAKPQSGWAHLAWTRYRLDISEWADIMISSSLGYVLKVVRGLEGLVERSSLDD